MLKSTIGTIFLLLILIFKMYEDLLVYGQYKKDIFEKLDFHFESWKKMLDVGCGDGTDAEIFIKKYNLEVYGIDVYTHDNIKNINWLNFQQNWIFDLDFQDWEFDYIFMHDVLHHIDEENQSYEKHTAALKRLQQLCKKGWYIIILEGNRYNPLFYPHMVKIHGHDHFKQSYFEKIMKDVYSNIQFKYFEAHFYPQKFLWFWKFYEKIMETLSPKQFLAYNVAVIKND